jgi:hypothetical protein
VSAKPRLLDLFSGAGGCAKGYQEAGFHVTGVDNRPQPHPRGKVAGLAYYRKWEAMQREGGERGDG